MSGFIGPLLAAGGVVNLANHTINATRFFSGTAIATFGLGSDAVAYEVVNGVTTNHTNLQENFRDFKAETQDHFKQLNDKLDEVATAVGEIRMVMAKWLGGGIVLMGIVQFAADHFLK